MERILGIDPGLNRTGYGVIHREQNRVILDEGGVVATNTSQPLAERICEIACEIREVIDQWKPTALAIEQVFSLGKNPKSAILLAHVRGAVLANAFESGLKIYHYKPTQIKKLLTGHGRVRRVLFRSARRKNRTRTLRSPSPSRCRRCLGHCVVSSAHLVSRPARRVTIIDPRIENHSGVYF